MITDTFLGLFLLNWNNGTFQREPLKPISVWAGSCHFRSRCSKTGRETTPVSVLQVLTQGLTDWDGLTLTPAAAGPALPHVFRDLCNPPAPPEQQEVAQGANSCPEALLHLLYCSQSTVRDPAEFLLRVVPAKTRLFVFLQPNFCLHWPVLLHTSSLALEEFPVYAPCGSCNTQEQTRRNLYKIL